MYTQHPIEGTYRRTRGSGASGFAVGLMHIDAPFPVVPGNPLNASTFDFPVLYQRVRALTGSEVISGDPSAEEKLVEAARLLEDAGVCAIAGTCGSFANFQQALRDAVSVPVFASILVQVPFILDTLPKSKSLGIIFADERAYTDRIIDQCRIQDHSRVRTTDCRDSSQFAAIIAGGDKFDEQHFVRFFNERVEHFLFENPDLGAIMLQCNELIPYAWLVQRVRDIPVFEISTLVRWLNGTLTQHPPAGFAYGVERVSAERRVP